MHIQTENHSNKYIWMAFVILVIIAIVGTAIDITGNTIRIRQLKTVREAPTPETITYKQLEKLLPNMLGGTVRITSGRLSNTGVFLASKQQTFDTRTPVGMENFRTILTQQQTAGYTLQIKSGARIYTVAP